MSLSIYADTFGKRNTPNGRLTDGQKADLATESLDAVQTVVDVLTDQHGRRFTVAFSPKVEALTDSARHIIVISSRPLFTKGLSLRHVVEVLTGLTAHEVGHVLIDSRGLIDAVRAKYPDSSLALRLANLIDDIVLERYMQHQYPGIGGAFVPTLRYVGRATIPESAKPFRHNPTQNKTYRFNFALAATRYAFVARWLADDATRRERAWWTDWSDRYADDTSIASRLAAVVEAIERLRLPVYGAVDDKAAVVSEPSLPKGYDAADDEPDMFEEDDEDYGDLDEERDGEGDEFDDDDDDTEWDDDESGGDVPGTDDGASYDLSDDESEPEPEPEDEPGALMPDVEASESKPSTDVPPTDEGESNPDDITSGDSDSDSAGGGVGEVAGPEEPDDSDIEDREVLGDVDTFNNPGALGVEDGWDVCDQPGEEWNADRLQQLVNTERSSERLRSGEWGQAKIEVHL